MSTSIAVIILTYNEEKHIKRCINSVKDIADEIFVVDSFSTDKTLDIARSLGAQTIQNEFINQSVQFNWALDHCSITSEWVLRIDADEYLINDREESLKDFLENVSDEISGLFLKRKIIFLDGPILHGGWYPKWNLRLFRYGHGRCENKWMDEHIFLKQGKSKKADFLIVDESLNDLSTWTSKHNRYATREALEHFLTGTEKQKSDSVEAKIFGNEPQNKRWLKEKYANFPLFLRPFLNFIYRYFILLGFLDGRRGFIWYVLQGFWYRFLVDAKIFELEKRFEGDREKIIRHIKETYGKEQNKEIQNT